MPTTESRDVRWTTFQPYANGVRGGFRTALSRLQQEAAAFGADGVVGIRLTRNKLDNADADAVDIDSLVRVLTSTMGEVLPAGMVEADRDRTITDRLTGREGTLIGIMITLPGIRLSLKHGRHRGGPIQAEIDRIVRGVVISRREVNLDEWVDALAGALSDLASRNADARQALIRLLERDR